MFCNLSKITKIVSVFFLILVIIIIPVEQRSLLIILFLVAILIAFPITSRKINSYSRFILPTFIILLFLMILPFIATLLLSIFHVDGSNLSSFQWPYTGFNNFIRLFETNIDILSIWRTIQFSTISVFFEIMIGLVLGVSFAKLSSKMDILRILFILPVVIPPLIAGMIWRSIFDQSFGLINQIIASIGINKIAWLSLSSPMKSLESFLNIRPGLGCALVAEVWQWTPFVALIITAALRTIPKEQIEWGKTQGASTKRMIREIYFPYIVPILGIIGILRMIDCLKTYESIWTLFANNSQTATLTIRITTYALEIRNFSVGASLSILYLLFMSFLIIIFVKKFFYTSKVF